MTTVEKHIIESYSGLFNSLGTLTKLELLERLAKSLKREGKSREKDFFKSFGAFGSKKSAEELAKEIKESRRFNLPIKGT